MTKPPARESDSAPMCAFGIVAPIRTKLTLDDDIAELAARQANAASKPRAHQGISSRHQRLIDAICRGESQGDKNPLRLGRVSLFAARVHAGRDRSLKPNGLPFPD